MKIKDILFKDKVLFYAIFFSFVWHVFWLSAVNVTVVPKKAPQVKFSGVAFLGPILDTGAFSISVAPRERTAIEERYLSSIENLHEVLAGAAPLHEGDRSFSAAPVDSDIMSGLAMAALDSGKLSPGRDL